MEAFAAASLDLALTGFSQGFPELPDPCPTERHVMNRLLAQLLYLSPAILLPLKSTGFSNSTQLLAAAGSAGRRGGRLRPTRLLTSRLRRW
jgi:hypothetical protein